MSQGRLAKGSVKDAVIHVNEGQIQLTAEQSPSPKSLVNKSSIPYLQDYFLI